MNRTRTVTNGPWNVSCMTGAYIKGAILSVFRVVNGKFIYGDANKKVFATTDEAWSYALEHGYCKVYVQPWCSHCRVRHTDRAGRREAWCDVTGSFTFSDEATAEETK